MIYKPVVYLHSDLDITGESLSFLKSNQVLVCFIYLFIYLKTGILATNNYQRIFNTATLKMIQIYIPFKL